MNLCVVTYILFETVFVSAPYTAVLFPPVTPPERAALRAESTFWSFQEFLPKSLALRVCFLRALSVRSRTAVAH